MINGNISILNQINSSKVQNICREMKPQHILSTPNIHYTLNLKNELASYNHPPLSSV
jgi:hypothetical protein